MLIRFKVSNFLSFNEQQEFSMIAGATKKKENHLINNENLKLLKFSAVYGANASGKSNLIKAVSFSKNIILKGLSFNVAKLYCRINKNNKDKISSFEFEVKINNKFYAYGFDMLLSENSIQAEWLYELDKPKNKEVLIYTRKLNEEINLNEKYFDNVEEIINRINVYYSDMKSQDNILFLTIMNKNKETMYKEFPDNHIKIFQDLYLWFKNTLTIIFPQGKLDNTPYFSSEENIGKINEIISTFGTGISECKAVKSNMQELKDNIPPDILNDMINTIEKSYIENVKNNEKAIVQQASIRINREMYILKRSMDHLTIEKIVLKHKNNDSEYSFSEESDGTQRLFDLIEVLISKNKEKVYLIDELDRCLHPKLTFEFVKRFLSNFEDENTQLVVTTHESRLLDFDLLRRDEIWFANREKYGPTQLYSLEEYNERFDKKIDKAYMRGRYGGVPIFETLSPIDEVEGRKNMLAKELDIIKTKDGRIGTVLGVWFDTTGLEVEFSDTAPETETID